MKAIQKLLVLISTLYAALLYSQPLQEPFVFETNLIDSLGVGLLDSRVQANLQSADLAVDRQGNKILVGRIRNSIPHDFDPGPASLQFPNTHGTGEVAGFVSSYNRLGNLNFAFQITDADIATRVSILFVNTDENNNIYIYGSFVGKIDLDPSTEINEVNTGNVFTTGYFLASYDTSGAFRWGIELNTPRNLQHPTGTKANIFSLDSFGNTYLLVDSLFNFDADPSTDEFLIEANTDYLISYDSMGEFRFGYKIPPNTFALGNGPDGTTYISGRLSIFDVTFDFDPSDGVFTLSDLENHSFFLASYSNNGTLNFVNEFKGVDASPLKLIGLENGEHFLAGKMGNGTIDFDASSDAELDVTTSTFEPDTGDLFFARYDRNGEVLMAKAIEDKVGQVSFEFLQDLEVDQFGNLIISGIFNGGVIDFDTASDSSFELSGSPFNNNFDSFFASYTNQGEFRFAHAITIQSSTDINALEIDPTCPAFYLMYNDYDITATGVVLSISDGGTTTNPICFQSDDDEDQDDDGVPDVADACPNTRIGALVDLLGCEVVSLPSDNFAIKTTGESCIAKNDGSIEIAAQIPLNYTAALTFNSTSRENMFTTNGVFSNLPSGDYTLCITVDGHEELVQCFDIAIVQPEALSVSSKINTSSKEVTLTLFGGSHFFIELNGNRHSTSDTEITLPLREITNRLLVTTDKGCQGSYEETLVLSTAPLLYPNPVAHEPLTIYLGTTTEADQVPITIFDTHGTRVLSEQLRIVKGLVHIDIEHLASGVYFLNLKHKTGTLNYKIIKK